MICNDCGTLLSDAVKFCSGCGASVGSHGGQQSSSGYDFDHGTLNRNGQSPVTALFTEPQSPPPPPPAPSMACTAHPAVTAAGVCVGCGNFYCRECLITHDGRNHCRNCSARLRAAPAPQTQSYQYQQPNQTFSQPGVPQPYQYPQAAPPYQYQQPYPYAQPVMPYIKRKEPGIALLLSFFLPGVGQLYNGDVGKGIAFIFGFWLLIWFGIGAIFWIWSMIDAYQSATNINFGRRV